MHNTIQQAKPSTVTNAKCFISNDAVLKTSITIPEFRYRVRRTINENLDNTIPETIIMRALTTEDNKLLLSEDGKILIY